jgi:hypothetical protein
MGCEYPNHTGDNDLLTAKSENLQINGMSLPENEEIISPIQTPKMPLELNHAIKFKLSKYSTIPPKFFEISEDEFLSVFNRNELAKDIIKLYSPQIDEIEYEKGVKYKDIAPIKVLDPEGGIQYYKGGFNSHGQCHGKGIWVKDLDIYIGNFRNDEFYGTGLFMNERGYYYFGQWKDSQCNGYGSLMMNQKLVYQGNFKNSKKEGYGEERYPDGDIYKGAFYDGQKNGKGQYIFADGSRYDGNFRNSKYSGFGQLSLTRGDVIRGDFRDGKLNGEGDISWNDGTKFVGLFVDDKKNGEGIFVWNNGKSYKGIWNDNDVYGTGTLKDPYRGTQESIMID